MTRSAFEVDHAALLAYVDNQLSDTNGACVAAWLAERPDATALVASWQRQNEAMATLFPRADHETLPPRLDPHRIAALRRARNLGRLRNLAAALLLAALGAGLGWVGRDYLAPGETAGDRLIDAAVSAHGLYVREKSHAVEVAAGAPNLMNWLSNRIAVPIEAPDLVAEGFGFLGGRLLPADAEGYAPGPAAQLMYENAAGQRVTLYITAPLADRKQVWTFATRGDVEAYYWANDSITCTLVGDLPESAMRLLGKQVFAQLARRPDPAWNAAG